MIAVRHLVVLGAAAMAVAACGGGSVSSAPSSTSRAAGDVTLTLTPTAGTTATQLASAADVLHARLAALSVPTHVAVVGSSLRVSGPAGLRIAVYTAEFPEVLSFREIRTQSSSSPTGERTATSLPGDGGGPTVTGLHPPRDESDQTSPLPATQAQFAALDCSHAPNGRPSLVDEDPHHFVVACDRTGQTKYLLTPADFDGADIASAQATEGQTSMGAGQSTGLWEVDLTFKDSAVPDVERVSTRLYHNNAQQLAITLDGVVLSAPQTNGVLGANLTISGGDPPFSKGEAQALAAVVNSGPLPIAFTVSGPR